jgi:hypothetical protein
VDETAPYMRHLKQHEILQGIMFIGTPVAKGLNDTLELEARFQCWMYFAIVLMATSAWLANRNNGMAALRVRKGPFPGFRCQSDALVDGLSALDHVVTIDRKIEPQVVQVMGRTPGG